MAETFRHCFQNYTFAYRGLFKGKPFFCKKKQFKKGFLVFEQKFLKNSDRNTFPGFQKKNKRSFISEELSDENCFWEEPNSFEKILWYKSEEVRTVCQNGTLCPQELFAGIQFIWKKLTSIFAGFERKLSNLWFGPIRLVFKGAFLIFRGFVKGKILFLKKFVSKFLISYSEWKSFWHLFALITYVS